MVAKFFIRRRQIALALGFLTGFVVAMVTIQGADPDSGMVFFPILVAVFCLASVAFIAIGEAIWGQELARIISLLLLAFLALSAWGSFEHRNDPEPVYCNGVLQKDYPGPLPESCQ